jgi:hypothetical protein
LFGGSAFEPTAFHHTIPFLIGAVRDTVLSDETSEAIGAGLKRPIFAVLCHHDGCFGNDLLGRSRLYLAMYGASEGWNFRSGKRDRGPHTS